MTSRLLGLGLAATVAAAGLTGCTTSHSYQASRQRAEATVEHYLANPHLHPPRYVAPAPKPVVNRVSRAAFEKLGDHYPDLFDPDSKYKLDTFFTERGKPEPILEIYDPCTGECTLEKPSEGRIISWSFNKLIDCLENDNPVRVSRDHVDRVSGDIKGWFKERTGGEFRESGIGFVIKWTY